MDGVYADAVQNKYFALNTGSMYYEESSYSEKKNRDYMGWKIPMLISGLHFYIQPSQVSSVSK
jgi:hypothetical protein